MQMSNYGNYGGKNKPSLNIIIIIINIIIIIIIIDPFSEKGFYVSRYVLWPGNIELLLGKTGEQKGVHILYSVPTFYQAYIIYSLINKVRAQTLLLWNYILQNDEVQFLSGIFPALTSGQVSNTYDYSVLTPACIKKWLNSTLTSCLL